MPSTADAAPSTGREVLTWQGFGDACADLAQQVRGSGFRPGVIVAVARGGLLPAGALSYALGVELADAINVERYADPSRPVADPILLAPLLDTESIAGQQLLVVDDVTDSGRTLGLVTRLLRGFGADVRSAVLFSKPNTIFAADFTWRHTDAWVEFPWSAQQDPTKGRTDG